VKLRQSSFEFSQSAIENDLSVVYALGSDLSIRYCNAAWDVFAGENGGADLARRHVAGRGLLEFISGPLADYYQKAFTGVLRTGEPWHIDYECSSAETLRRFTMHVHPMSGKDGLLVVNSLTVQHPHRGEGLDGLESIYREPGGQIVMCSNCRRTQRIGTEVWDWVPAFISGRLEKVSHGICTPCGECYYPGLL
jgi:hypothetical protein